MLLQILQRLTGDQKVINIEISSSQHSPLQTSFSLVLNLWTALIVLVYLDHLSLAAESLQMRGL